MLCLWNGRYYLPWRFEEVQVEGGTKECFVLLDANGRSDEAGRGFTPLENPGGRISWRRRFRISEDIVFYRIKFRGYKAITRGWTPAWDSSRLTIEVVGGWEERPDMLDYVSPAYRRVCDELKPLGFVEVPHDGGLRGEVGIEELEKIEIPPPRGPF